MKQVIKIDVVSDVVCPWCYIGKRRLEKAVESLSDQYDFEINYHPFELHPELPVEGQNQREYLIEKFGNEDRYQQLTGNVAQIALVEGLKFDFDKQMVMPNTRKAHVIIAGGKEADKQAAVSEAFFESYFSSGIDLSNDENLITVGVNAGLERNQIETWLADESRFEEIQSREQELSGLGIHAVPFFILNEKFGLSGAQPAETFVNVIKEVGNKSSVEAPSCGPDGYC